MEFNEYAQTRTVTGNRAINSPEELRELIQRHNAWGWSLEAFQEKAGVRIEGDTAYVTTFYWNGSASTLTEMWSLVQNEGQITVRE
ncbi:hypothetical protein [Deinococcus altitudinis]|uniref:hypothetical protein n=1 Tax=Deinococcus altitudinis TaxID=468914 RepID=UPI003891C1C6